MSAWRSPLLVVGHRGGRGEGWPPENTMAAFERARSEGARAVELDVRPSADGRAVVFHDPELSRATRARDARRVCEVPARELMSIALGQAESTRVPLLAEVLAWARDRDVAVNVELKYDVPRLGALARAVAPVVREARADVLFSSFDPRLLAWMAVLAPAVPRALLTHARQRTWLGRLRAVLRPPVAQAVHLEVEEAAPALVSSLLARGLRVGVWTVNDPVGALRLVDEGVASIITDAPGQMVATLRDRKSPSPRACSGGPAA